MRKLLIFFSICLVVTAAAAAVTAREQLNRRVILLTNGKIIPVDRVWQMGADLFYENETETRFVALAEVKAIENQTLPLMLKTAGAQLTGYFNGCRKAIGDRFQGCAVPAELLNPALWLVLAAAAAPAVLFFFIRRHRRRIPPQNAPRTAPAPASKETSPEISNRADVIRFFLYLYRQQVGAGPEAPSEFTQLNDVSTGPNLVFELRVKHGGDWVKRRMTIGPLGEESGSKSKCYYVIFDRHLVVKIPPKPVADLDAYLGSIKKEGHIVERLVPKECIVPKVSFILGLIHPLPHLPGSAPDQVEEKYVAWLRKNPEYQNYLKIKGTFVYFMDLSRYYFLSQIMDGLHDLSAPIRAEIAATADLIRYPAKVKERYDDVDEAVGFEIRDLYNHCEADIRRWLKERGKPSAAGPYRFQSWFLHFLEKKTIGRDDPELSAGEMAEIESVFARRFEKDRRSVDAFLGAVHRFAGRLCLEQNLAPMSGIVSNLLDLLAWLHTRSVAMRDLKPDNILVAGDPQTYPAFLRSAADYSLGFIDVETAVYFGKTAQDRTRQPLLGGTPYYATPSHLFPNPVFEACFGDSARILHLQDWHAVMVMIFKVVTGELLFESTAKLFVDIKARVLEAARQGEPLGPQFEEVSRTFWRSAAAEFRARMKNRETVLERVKAEIPKTAKPLLIQVLKRDIESIHASMRGVIESQVVFASPSGREQLYRSSSVRVGQILEELQARAKTSKGSPASVESSRRLLQSLSALKALAERKSQLLSALGAEAASRVSAYDLLVLMFGHVLKGMNRENWKPVAAETSHPAGPPNDELSMATTI